MDAESKLILSWFIGPRDLRSARPFMLDLRERLSVRPQITSDGLHAYRNAIEEAFGVDVDYAQLVKEYRPPRESEPPQCECTITAVSGLPARRRVSTSLVERQNLTMRMSMRRFTRLTNAFSKKLEHHAWHVALHFVHYNFCRIHKTLRMAPAMAAGVSDTLLDVEWIVGLIDAATPTPGPRGPYRKRVPKG